MSRSGRERLGKCYNHTEGFSVYKFICSLQLEIFIPLPSQPFSSNQSRSKILFFFGPKNMIVIWKSQAKWLMH